MAIKKKNPLQMLVDIRRGSYKKGTQGYDALMYYRNNDPYKLTSHTKSISYNTIKDVFTVK